MLKEQKKLLADARAVERDALKLYGAGVKISGVVRKIRAAADELQARVSFIEKQNKIEAATARAEKTQQPATVID